MLAHATELGLTGRRRYFDPIDPLSPDFADVHEDTFFRGFLRAHASAPRCMT